MSKVEREVVTVYIVHRGWRNGDPLELIEATATRSAKQTRLDKWASAFGNQQGPPDQFAYTAVEAFNRFRDKALQAKRNAKVRLAEAERDIAECESLFCRHVSAPK